MAQQIQFRRGTASEWTAVNPILAEGELGFETDTHQFKIGDGVTQWSSLSYGGLVGPADPSSGQQFGDGTDGDVSLNSGTTTLLRDMFYNSLTLSGTARINTGGFRIFVKTSLDISAAAALAISNIGGNGSNASNQTGGALGTGASANTLGGSGAATAGGTGVVGVGVASTALTNIIGNGGVGGAPGPGGAGASGAGSAGVTVGAVITTPIKWLSHYFMRGASILSSGCGGRGGHSGAGDGTNLGRGGGGGGGGAGHIAIYANNIVKSASTSASCIAAFGGSGGNGASATAGNVGGGGGGGGGAGGWVYIAYNNLIGDTAVGAIDVSGGAGGTGGNGFGTGIGGTGGGSGGGGRVTLIRATDNAVTEFVGTAGSTPALVATITGGAGSVLNTNKVNL